MSQKINQAVNQVRLTNVAVVKLKKNGQRFEVACYRNKVENWRSGLETDIEEVLQIDRVFANVSKGVVAKKKDLIEAFGTDDQDAICKIILEKGTSQVSDRERAMHYESKFKNIATIVSEKCINPTTMRPYPVSTIETAMKNTIHYAVIPNKSAKQQALDVIRELELHMPLKRAQMLVRITIAASCKAELESTLSNMSATVTKVETNLQNTTETVLIDPGSFRPLTEFLGSLSPVGVMEVKDFSVQEDDEADVEVTGDRIAQMSLAEGSKEESTPEHSSPSQETENAEKLKEMENEVEEGEQDDMDVYAAQVKHSQNLKKDKKKKKKQQRRAKRQQDDDEDDDEDEESNDVPQAKPSQPVQEAVEPPIPAPIETSAGQEETNVDSSDTPVYTSGLKCLTCGVFFGNDRNLQREHYRSDLHRLNLKLKMKNLPTMTDEEFSLLGQQERDSILLDYM